MRPRPYDANRKAVEDENVRLLAEIAREHELFLTAHRDNMKGAALLADAVKLREVAESEVERLTESAAGFEMAWFSEKQENATLVAKLNKFEVDEVGYLDIINRLEHCIETATTKVLRTAAGRERAILAGFKATAQAIREARLDTTDEPHQVWMHGFTVGKDSAARIVEGVYTRLQDRLALHEAPQDEGEGAKFKPEKSTPGEK